MPSITRSLERHGEKLTLEVAGKTFVQKGKKTETEALDSPWGAAERLVDVTRTRLGQGWEPTTKPEAVGAFVDALDEAGVDMASWIVALTDAEAKHAFAKAMKAGEVGVEVFRRRPTREVFAWMLTKFDDYYEDDLTKAVKFLSKTPEMASWIQEELARALENDALPTDRAKKFAARNAKKIAAGPKPAPKAPTKATGNEGDLLAMIAKAPKDDAPRLVYADWLLEQGNGFGEFIEVSCKLAPLDFDDPTYDETQAKADKLEKKHAKAWLEPIRPFIRSWAFERGMISRVTCDAALFTQAADAIALRAPRAMIELTGLKKKDVAALAKTPLGAFDTIGLDSQRIEDEGMKLIAASPTIAGASRWLLGYNAFGDDGIRAIAASPHFASAESLTFRSFRPQFSARALHDLLAARALPSVKELEISVTSVDGAFDDCRLALEQLSITTPTFTRDDARSLAKAKSLRGLTYLAISRSGERRIEMDDDVVKTLCDAFPKLKTFSTNEDLSKSAQARVDALEQRAS